MFQLLAIIGGICLSKMFLEEDDSCKYTRFSIYISNSLQDYDSYLELRNGYQIFLKVFIKADKFYF